MFFFFRQKTAYEMRISDWSSDVCSSDLHRGKRSPRCIAWLARSGCTGARLGGAADAVSGVVQAGKTSVPGPARGSGPAERDRKSVVSGQSVSVRVDLGGRRLIKKKIYLLTVTIV